MTEQEQWELDRLEAELTNAVLGVFSKQPRGLIAGTEQGMDPVRKACEEAYNHLYPSPSYEVEIIPQTMEERQRRESPRMRIKIHPSPGRVFSDSQIASMSGVWSDEDLDKMKGKK